MEVVYLTKKGLTKLEAELRKYEGEMRPQASRNMEEARKHGDLTENAEYDAAKEELARIETHIYKIRRKLANVHLIDADKIGTDKVHILNKVELEDLDSGTTFNYVLVSPEEVEIDRNMISVKSPVGKALLGGRVGEIVNFTVPAGEKRWKIININPPES
ncbi:MAG: transcription elongation factor GreA [candidate division Zixibacteria bacterium]|nr:transcription elongation factor GreA [Candidatus Tariuqbacter arcticus]